VVTACLGVGLAGCADKTAGAWPSLAPRPGEAAPMVPRTALACQGCGAEFAGAPVPNSSPPPAPRLAPADAARRLEAAAATVAAAEAKVPAQQRVTAAAVAAARGAPADSDRASLAEVERSRFENLFLPLAEPARQLDALEDELVGTAGSEALTAGIAALRERLAVLERERRAFE